MLRKFYESVVASAIVCAVVQRIATDSINWSTRSVMLWVWSSTLWQRFQKGGCCPSYGQYLTVLYTLAIFCWKATVARSAKDSVYHDVPQNTTGKHSYLRRLNFTTPPNDIWTIFHLWYLAYTVHSVVNFGIFNLTLLFMFKLILIPYPYSLLLFSAVIACFTFFSGKPRTLFSQHENNKSD